MTILALDDEKLALESLVKYIKAVKEDAEVFAFNSANEALNFAKTQKIDTAFLDIQGMDMDGVSLAKNLKKIYPKINIIFCTGFSDYAMDAFKLVASGYILKPITRKKIQEAFENLRYESNEQNNGLRFQCFGNFDIFYNGKPLEFKYSKSKELLAFLYDKKGASCSINEILTALWEDDANHQSYLKQMRKDIEDVLESINKQDILLKAHGSLAIDFQNIKSDYANLLNGKPGPDETYNGEYMNQYSWAEETNGYLLRKYNFD